MSNALFLILLFAFLSIGLGLATAYLVEALKKAKDETKKYKLSLELTKQERDEARKEIAEKDKISVQLISDLTQQLELKITMLGDSWAREQFLRETVASIKKENLDLKNKQR